MKLQVFLLLLSLQFLFAQPKPGDVFREYTWYNSGGSGGGALRVGGSLDYGGGDLSHGTSIDLVDAIRAEIIVEKLQCHTRTHSLSIDFNKKGWLKVPEADNIPVHPKMFQHHIYPVFSIPVSSLNQGTNNQFRMKVYPDPNVWEQNLIYGVHIRVYYDPSLKAHPTGQITAPVSGGKLAESVSLKTEATPNGSAIKSVQYIGNYEDVNYEGDGKYKQWHYHYYKGALMHNLGSSSSAPFTANWNTNWVPDQLYPFEIAARIVDQSGMTYFTEPVANLQFDRPNNSIILIKPYNVPMQWVTRSGDHHEKFFIRSDLDRISAAQMAWTCWGPGHAHGIYINDTKVWDKEGQAHRYYFLRVNIANVSVFKENENILMTGASESGHHGMEVQWPGIMMLLNADFSNAPKTPPLSPDSVTVEFVGSGIKIDWQDNADNEKGFIIERKSEGGFYAIIGKTNWAEHTVFIDSTFDLAKKHVYRVLAFNDHGSSASEEILVSTPNQKDFLLFRDQSEYMPKVNWLEKAGFYFLQDYKGIDKQYGVLKTVPNRPYTSTYIGNSFSFINSNSITQSIYFKGAAIKTRGIEAFKLGLISTAGDELDFGSSDSSFISFTLEVSKSENTWRLNCYNSKGSTEYEVVDSTLNTIPAETKWYKLNVTWQKTNDDSISYLASLDAANNLGVLNLSGKLYNTSISADDSIFAAIEAHDKAGIDALDNFFVYTQSQSLTNIDKTLVSAKPKQFALFQNYPNPFNPLTTIKYSLQKAGKVNIEIFNVLGQKIATLANEYKYAGTYNIHWNASSMPTGLYFYIFKYENKMREVKKMMLIK